MKKIYYILIPLMAACSQAPSLQDQIAELETKIESGENIPETKLAGLYVQFAEANVTDSLSEVYLDKAGTIYSGAADHDNVLRIDSLLKTHYDSSEFRYNSSLLAANSLLKLERAGDAIQKFEQVQNEYRLENKDLHQLKKAYLQYVEEFPEDKKTEDYSIKAANLLGMSGGATQAIALLEKLVSTNPTSQFAPYALMRSADLYEVQLKDLDAAKSTLNKLISEYPESNFARDAQIILDKNMLGLSDEEKFQKIIAGKSQE